MIDKLGGFKAYTTPQASQSLFMTSFWVTPKPENIFPDCDDSLSIWD